MLRKLFFLILSNLFILFTPNVFAQEIGVADMDISWLSTTSTGLNHSYTNNYTLGTAVQFGTDPNPYYNITRFGGGVTFTGISQNAIVTARVNYLISSSLPIPGVGSASCMAYSSGMGALTANLQSVTPAYNNGDLIGYTFTCYYQYQSLTPHYTFFGIEGPKGGTESMFQGYFTPTQTFLSYNIIDLAVNDPNAANSTIIIQNQEIINQNNQMLDKQDQTNNNLNDIKDSINSDNVDDSLSDINGFFDNFDSGTHGNLTDIITLPLDFLNSLNNTCSPISLTLPYLNTSFEIPCISQYLGQFIPNQLLDLIRLIINGFISYRCISSLILFINSLKDPNNSDLEVLDL